MKLFSILIIAMVLVAGCTAPDATATTTTTLAAGADTTQESLNQATSADNDLGADETADVDSDLDEVIDTLG